MFLLIRYLFLLSDTTTLSNLSHFTECGREGSVRVQEGGRGGEVLRHHLQRPRGELQWGHPAQGPGWQTLRPEENLQSGEREILFYVL